MQSIASLMSIGRANDIGNLDDMDDDIAGDNKDSEDEDISTMRRHTEAQITSLASQLGQLADQNYDDEGDDNGNVFRTVGRFMYEGWGGVGWDFVMKKGETRVSYSEIV